jgi:hypothetical protein
MVAPGANVGPQLGVSLVVRATTTPEWLEYCARVGTFCAWQKSGLC